MAIVTSKTERKVIETKTVTLVLNEREAKTLSLVLARVGGSPENSRRKHTDDIARELEKVMGDPYYYPEKIYIDRTNRALSFDNEAGFDKLPE